MLFGIFVAIISISFALRPSALGLGARTSQIHPGFYFADVEDYYKSNPFEYSRKGAALDYKTFGDQVLGSLIDKEAGLWTTHWSVLDLWWIRQIYTSPLRVYDYKKADIVFVAAVLDPQRGNDHQCRSFFDEYAARAFPDLDNKPHILVLSHGLVYQYPDWDGKFPRCWQHAGAKKFTILSSEGVAGGIDWDYTNFVAIPMMSHIHWHRGSQLLWQRYNASHIATSKTLLVFSSFLVDRYPSYPSRIRAHEQCVAAQNKCEHYNFDIHQEQSSLARCQEGFRKSWYTLMPHADFKIRNSLYDALAGLSMPVVFEADFMDHLPFKDIVDYTAFVRYVDEGLFVPDSASGDIITYLSDEHKLHDALDSLQYLHSIAHVFQYMTNPVHELIRFDQQNIINPEDDAFTFSVKSLLRHLCGRGKLPSKCCRAGRLGKTAGRLHVQVQA